MAKAVSSRDAPKRNGAGALSLEKVDDTKDDAAKLGEAAAREVGATEAEAKIVGAVTGVLAEEELTKTPALEVPNRGDSIFTMRGALFRHRGTPSGARFRLLTV